MVTSEYKTFQLKNGIRIIHQQTGSDVAHLGVIINAGSRDEEEHEHGIAHFIEHSFFKGTKKRKAFHILSRIEDVGGEINAYTTKEETALFATFLSEYYERSTELLSDIIFNSTFPEKEISKEKEVIMEEINSFKDTPSDLIFDEFDELIYDGHPIARNILGTPETLKTFTRDHIFSFISKNYKSSQIVISSVGNISSQKLILLVEKYFGAANEKQRDNKRVKHSGYIPSEKFVKRDTFQAHCVIGNLAFDSHHPLRISMVLLNSLLGGQSMNARLNLALRERKGMAYNIESNYTAYSDTGLFNIYFGTDKENLDKAIKIVYKELNRLKHKSLGNVQLMKAKKQLIGQMAISAENREDLMLTIGKSYLLYNKVDSLSKVFEKIEAVSAFDILEAANIVWDDKQMSQLVFY